MSALPCCLNCTFVNDSQHLSVPAPRQGNGKCHVPVQGSKLLLPSPALSLCSHLLPSAWQQSCRLWWGSTELRFEEWYHVCWSRAQGKCRCEKWYCLKFPALFLRLITCGSVKMLLNNNLKALFVIEVLHLLSAFTVPLEILTFGIERIEGLGHVLPNLLSTGWLRCV